MRSLIIVGNGSYARMMKRYIELTDYGKVIAYTVDEEYIQEDMQDGVKVCSPKELKASFPCEDLALIMGIGYKQMGNIRESMFKKYKLLGYGFENYIHPTAIIEKNVTLGEGNNILEGVILEESVVLGDANLLFGGSIVAHETVLGSFNTLSVRAVVAGCACIGNHCFIGASGVVKDHVKFEDYVLLGASAYGFQDMEQYSVVVPARSNRLEGRSSMEFL